MNYRISAKHVRNSSTNSSGCSQAAKWPPRSSWFQWTIFFIRRSTQLRGVESELVGRAWDVIHIHTPFRAHSLGVRLGKRRGVPTVETYHTYFEEYVAHYLPWLPGSGLAITHLSSDPN